jgi:hypothetical protein
MIDTLVLVVRASSLNDDSRSGQSRHIQRMLGGVIPWLIVAVVVVPLVVVAFVLTRRKSAKAMPEIDEIDTEREFAAAEAYEAEWHEADKERFHNERLP